MNLIIATTEAATSSSAVPWLATILILIIATGFSLGLRRLSRLEARYSLHRWVPAAHIVVWAVATGIVVAAVASYGFTSALLIVVLTLAALVIATMTWLKSLLAGLILLTGSELHPGEHIQVAGYRGEVLSVGLRSIRLRDAQGIIHQIPHAELLQQPISRFPDAGLIPCELDMRIESNEPSSAILETIRTVTALAPLAAPRRRAQVFLLSPPLADEPLQVRIQAYPCSSEYHDALKSDLLRRLAQRFK